MTTLTTLSIIATF